jgi:hypothetical protein
VVKVEKTPGRVVTARASLFLGAGMSRGCAAAYEFVEPHGIDEHSATDPHERRPQAFLIRCAFQPTQLIGRLDRDAVGLRLCRPREWD